MRTALNAGKIHHIWLDLAQALPAVVQGRRLKKVVPLLGEASGPKTGMAVSSVIDGVPTRLLVIGESTVAGTGAPTHDVALTGQLASRIALLRQRNVAWVAEGTNGATLRQIGRSVPILVNKHDPDIVVLAAGANDVMTGRRPRNWGEDLVSLLNEVIDPERPREVVVAGVPPFRHFPALPAPLNSFLDRRAGRLDAVTAQICTEMGARFVPFDDSQPLGDDFFGADRFHPSAVGYRRWAESLFGAPQQASR